MDPGPRPTDDEMTALVAELHDAGLLTIGTDADGKETWTLTAAGVQVARQMAMSAEDDALELLTALLEARELVTDYEVQIWLVPSSTFKWTAGGLRTQ